VTALALAWLNQVSAEPLQPASIQAAGEFYDEVVAHIPQKQARIGSVALAELTIALHQAKLRAEQTLCLGNWTPSGETVQRVGPLRMEAQGRPKVWLYRSLRRAHPLACQHVSRTQFFQEMSRHLPAWVSIRPAGQTLSFNLGHAQPLPPSRLAVR